MATEKMPGYRVRKHRGRGRELAVVTLTDAVTGRRKDYALGPARSPESFEAYHRLLAQWQAAGKRLPDVPREPKLDGPTVSQICAAYCQAEPDEVKRKMRWMSPAGIALLEAMHGPRAAENFGPNALREIREAMIQGDPMAGRPKWTQSVVVRHVAHIVHIFRWAAAHEMLPNEVWRRLEALEPISRYRTDVKPRRKVDPVPIRDVRKAQAAANRQVAALIELQLLTGARVEELLFLQPADIDRSGEVWRSLLDEHKTAHHGKRRVIYFGPRAQKVLMPFLLRGPEQYLFSPAEAAAERRKLASQNRTTPLSCGNRPGTNKKSEPKKKPRDHYDANSYRRSVESACKKAGVPVWTPRQLRHNAASMIEERYDSVVAAIMLGHSSAKITEAVYIQRDTKKAVEVSAAIG